MQESKNVLPSTRKYDGQCPSMCLSLLSRGHNMLWVAFSTCASPPACFVPFLLGPPSELSGALFWAVPLDWARGPLLSWGQIASFYRVCRDVVVPGPPGFLHSTRPTFDLIWTTHDVLLANALRHLGHLLPSNTSSGILYLCAPIL